MHDPLKNPDFLRRKQAFLESLSIEGDIWVFGYGSLMWDPGFDFAESQVALLRGWRRSFCVYSHRYRGTPEKPGLVLGLDRGGSCKGIAYRVAQDRALEALSYLFDREMFLGVYRPRIVDALCGDRRRRCHVFTVRRNHRQYAASLSPEETVRIIREAVGQNGPNRDYLANTVRHLDELGLTSGPLHRLLSRVENPD